MNVAIIPARGGSKRIIKKNVKLFLGKPIIAYSIENAINSLIFDKVIVSTDDDEIARIAIEYGAEVPFMRPEELARDDSPEWLAWRHALNYLLEAEGSLPEVMVSIPTTAPLRSPLDIENCLDEYEKGGADMVITVTDAHRSPYFNMVRGNEDGSVSLVIPPKKTLARRQDTPTVYDMATVSYVANPEFVMMHQSHFEGKVRAVHVPLERAIDIDTLMDFRMAEFFLSQKESLG